MECAMVCPDAAIPNTVHDIHDLLLTAIGKLDITEQHKSEMQKQVFPLTKAIRDIYRNLLSKDDQSFSEIVLQSLSSLETSTTTNWASLKRDFEKMVEILDCFPVAKTRPFFDAMEKNEAGSGGLYSVNIDPWKCTGCAECVDVCGPGALSTEKQSSQLQAEMSQNFEFLSEMPNTAARFTENAIQPGGDSKRLLLDHDNYYAMTGGHGACRGCGEVTAIRLLTATNKAIHEKKRKSHIDDLEALLSKLNTKLENIPVDKNDPDRVLRIQKTLDILEKRLYLFESGPTGNGPSFAAFANATGCSSVYASTFPSNPYKDPWVNSLFQDTPAVAKGMFEGFCATAVDDFTALRTAKLDLEDNYDPQYHDELFRCFNWHHFSKEEFSLLPAVISMGGDGATYDIGFGALSRVLVSETPIKIVVLNIGAYSNTGGQTSTASYTAQDSDLTRFGGAHRGKREDRKELGLIAAFHPNVLVIQTNAALQSHFMKNVMNFLTYNESSAVFDTYTTCQPEHGIADDAGNRRAMLAVESRMSPVFVHDPRRGNTLAERFSLEGNPEIGKDWINTTLDYIDDEGKTRLLERPFTAADFALNEGRFKKHFHPVTQDDDPLPIDEYIDLNKTNRYGKVPFVWSTTAEGKLIKLTMSSAIVELTEERLRNWRMLEYLGGLHIHRMEAEHRDELDNWQQKYQQSSVAREASIDSIAMGMAELASISGAPAIPVDKLIPVTIDRSATDTVSQVTAIASAAGTDTGYLVEITETDMVNCTNCKTCYQDLSELFEKTKIMVGGSSKEVSRVIPGVFDNIEITQELVQRASRVADDCDVEIIRFHQPT